MARSKKKLYSINVHYPEDNEEMLSIRKNMAIAYNKFISNYILTLPITDEQKNKVYSEVQELLKKH